MGIKGVEILDLDVKKLIEMMNAALAEEWLAYYQYWVGARVMEGPMRKEIELELLLHADEELGHAVQLIDRIIELNGTPVLTPYDWQKLAGCKYEAPTDPYVEKILMQNLDGERCAIQRYQDLADYTNGKDYVTHQIVTGILKDELEHEHDIEDFLMDIEHMKKDACSIK
jgi:bacterioferritin